MAIQAFDLGQASSELGFLAAALQPAADDFCDEADAILHDGRPFSYALSAPQYQCTNATATNRDRHGKHPCEVGPTRVVELFECCHRQFVEARDQHRSDVKTSEQPRPPKWLGPHLCVLLARVRLGAIGPNTSVVAELNQRGALDVEDDAHIRQRPCRTAVWNS
jgi:hypothetical protein